MPAPVESVFADRPVDTHAEHRVGSNCPPSWQDLVQNGRHHLSVTGESVAALATGPKTGGLGGRAARIERELKKGDCVPLGYGPPNTVIRGTRAATVASSSAREKMRRLRPGFTRHVSPRRFSFLRVVPHLEGKSFGGIHKFQRRKTRAACPQTGIDASKKEATAPIFGLEDLRSLDNEARSSLKQAPRRPQAEAPSRTSDADETTRRTPVVKRVFGEPRGRSRQD